jgi:hypothetical protein
MAQRIPNISKTIFFFKSKILANNSIYRGYRGYVKCRMEKKSLRDGQNFRKEP